MECKAITAVPGTQVVLKKRGCGYNNIVMMDSSLLAPFHCPLKLGLLLKECPHLQAVPGT